MNILDTFYNDLTEIIASVVIKFDNKAKEYETLDTTKASDRYISAIQQQDSFNTYQSFDQQAVINAGVNDPTLAAAYAANKYLIPNNMRDNIVEQQRQLIINSYVEENNYYRMLQGMPNVEDTDFIFVDRDLAISLDLNPDTPIHEYRDDELLNLEKKGIIESLKTLYPTKEYLKFLGLNRIDLIRARTAKPFSILSLSKDISESMYNMFNNTYDQCREYFMSVIHNKNFASTYPMYNNFIGLMIMTTTVQQTITNIYKSGVERDFYDLGSIKMLFDSYNVPFIVDLPIEYQRMLVRNLNKFLYYKSTDRVFYDICELLGFSRIQIFKYYLIKEHRLDENDIPIFPKKTIDNGDGTTSEIEDTESMYDIYFQTVELRDRNRALALSNTSNKLDYNQVVLNDPYWWDDDADLHDKIYNSDYNFVETKYISLNIMYKLTEMLFEVIYAFHMILDKKDEEEDIVIELPKIFENKKIPIFNVVVFMCALISHKNNMDGNIISTPSQALDILGFNFHADFTAIRNEISNDPKLDDDMLRWIASMDIDDPRDINLLYSNIKQLNDFIISKLASTQDLEVYRAYKKLYNALMITQDIQAVFKKSDGTTATTFLDYLDDVDPVLSTFVRTCETSKISDYIDHILFKVNEVVTNLQYLYILNDSNNVLLNAAITLIKFFKSYTIDVASFNILYLMNDRFHNMLKFMGKFEQVVSSIQLNDTSAVAFYKSMMSYTSTIHYVDKVFKKEITDNMKTQSVNRYSDKQIIHDSLIIVES